MRFRLFLVCVLCLFALHGRAYAFDVNALASGTQQKSTPESWIQKGQIPNYDESYLNNPQGLENSQRAQKMMDLANQLTNAQYSYACSLIRKVDDKTLFNCDVTGGVFPTLATCQTGCIADYACSKIDCTLSAQNCYTMDTICPAGSTLGVATDNCEAAAVITCPAGFTYDAVVDICEQPASCANNGVLNIVIDKCQLAFSDTLCPSGYLWDQTVNACTGDMTCPNGGTYNSTRKRCEQSPTTSCASGYTFDNASGKCLTDPVCMAGTSYNSTLDLCIAAATLSCPSGGYVWNSGTGFCEVVPTCAGGSTYSTSADKCVSGATIGCASGYSYNNSTGKCEQPPTCLTGGSYNAATNRCEASISYQCPYNGNTYGDSTTCSNNCYQTGSCNANTTACGGKCGPTNVTAQYYSPLIDSVEDLINGGQVGVWKCKEALPEGSHARLL